MKEKLSFLDREHAELLEKIQGFSTCDGELGKNFKEAMGKFGSHLEKEEVTVIPLLKYLGSRIRPDQVSRTFKPYSARDGFRAEYQTMLGEHRQIEKILDRISKLEGTVNQKAQELVMELKHHIEVEEEVLYPAASAAGDLMTNSLKESTPEITGTSSH